jgi:hypothetical protein
MHLLFCQNPLAPSEPDYGFEEEVEAAKACGHTVHLINWEALVKERNPAKALRKLPEVPSGTVALYRGWMLRPDDYAALMEAVSAKGYFPLTSPEQYRRCHHLPEAYPFLEGRTPKSVWLPVESSEPDWQRLFALAASFGDVPLVLKDYVKSEKHDWLEACFIPSALDEKHLRKVAETFLGLRGKELNEGLVLREFVPLRQIGVHPQSGLPLMLEYRLFFLNTHCIACLHYWDEGDYTGLPTPPIVEFAALANSLQCSFLSMDVAMTQQGEWIVMEVGDGQVSGLPDNADKKEFYSMMG